jgi:hypothetical protein
MTSGKHLLSCPVMLRSRTAGVNAGMTDGCNRLSGRSASGLAAWPMAMAVTIRLGIVPCLEHGPAANFWRHK